MSTTLMSIRVDTELKAKLEALAEATQRSKSFLAIEALESYVKREAWQVAHIQEGIDQSEKGLFVAGEDVDKWLSSWGSEGELPPPKIQKKARR